MSNKGIRIAEYLGQRTDTDIPITPVPHPFTQPIHLCPFMNLPCAKMKMQTNAKFPICSLRRNGELYIVCEHRLASTSRQQELAIAPYQADMLHMLAQEIFDPHITRDEIAFKAEVIMQSKHKADYMLSRLSNERAVIGPTRLIVEMQGGGETSNTGKMTDKVRQWTVSSMPSNASLSEAISGIGTIQTNAWRRLQEQILAKASVAVATSPHYGFVGCIGTILFDYVKKELDNFTGLEASRNEWNTALIAFRENPKAALTSGPVPLEIDPDRKLYTTFDKLARALTSRGMTDAQAFQGTYRTLSGKLINLE